jgi:hypothetical protein
MTKGDKVLVILFRYLLGIGGLFALVPVVMPWSWMAATHRWLGLGEMPNGPIVEYLARSLSAFYALVGVLCLVMASDLDRYRPLVRFFGACLALLGIVFTGVDLAAGMPWWWTAFEGPGGVAFGALLFVLARPADSKGGTA